MSEDIHVTVYECDVKHEAPYNFHWCTIHDLTFSLEDGCPHRGLSEIDWLDLQEAEQYARAVRAEATLHCLLEDISELLEELSELHTEGITGTCNDCLHHCPCPTQQHIANYRNSSSALLDTRLSAALDSRSKARDKGESNE